MEREVIIFAPNIYGRKGLVSLLECQGERNLKPIVVQDPKEIITACNDMTSLVIYQVLEGAVFTGTVRSMVQVSAYWPNVGLVLSSDKLMGVFKYISSTLGGISLWEPRLSVASLGELLKKELDTYCQQAEFQKKKKIFQRQPNDVFTARQRNIFQLQARGLNVSEIAQQLYMLPQTVHSHRYQAYRRLGIRSSAEQQSFSQIIDELIALSAVGFSSPMETVAIMEALSKVSLYDYSFLYSLALQSLI